MVFRLFASQYVVIYTDFAMKAMMIDDYRYCVVYLQSTTDTISCAVFNITRRFFNFRYGDVESSVTSCFCLINGCECAFFFAFFWLF